MMRRHDMTARQFRALFPEFGAPSWAPWNAVEDAIFGVSLDPEPAALVRRLTGRTTLPAAPVAEFWGIAGRGSGKSRVAGRLAAFLGCARSYRLAPGEFAYVGVFAPDRKQAQVTLRYIRGLLYAVPALKRLIVRETSDSLELSTRVVIEVITASTAAPRGRSYAAVIIEEACFLPPDDSANPDAELLRAVRPALARVPGSLLLVISSPYAMKGSVYQAWRTKWGTDDPDVLVVRASTLELNPSFSQREIARAYREDPESARAEYGGEFRAGISTLFDDAALAACVPEGVRERAAGSGRRLAHIDPATGAGADAFGFAVAEARGDRRVLLCVRRWPPPFNPTSVAAEVATLCREHAVTDVTRDQFASGLVDDLFRQQGLAVRAADCDTSDAFLRLVALVNSRQVELLDHPDLLRELRGLERRTGFAGRDRVSHPPNGHDDLAAAAAFCLVGLGTAHAGFLTWMRDKAGQAAPVTAPPDADPDELVLRHQACRVTGRPRYATIGGRSICQTCGCDVGRAPDAPTPPVVGAMPARDIPNIDQRIFERGL
jgi:hypothetical protein